MKGTTVGVIRGDARSLDYSLFRFTMVDIGL